MGLRRMWYPLGFLLCAGICAATQFPYSISCQAVTVGPDTIDAYTQSASVDLTPYVPNTSNTIDFFNARTEGVLSGVSATFDSTLACTFNLGGVTTQVNRPFQLVVAVTTLSGGFTAESHLYTLQSFSLTVSIPGQGTITVSQGSRIIGNPGAGIIGTPPASSTLLFVPSQPNPIPLPPSLLLSVTGVAGIGFYEIRRRYRRRYSRNSRKHSSK